MTQTTTQHFQRYEDGLPQGMMIERRVEAFYCFYTIYGSNEQGEYSTTRRFVTTDDTGLLAYLMRFDSHESALTFMRGFIACLQSFNGIGQREIEAAIAAWWNVPSYTSRYAALRTTLPAFWQAVGTYAMMRKQEEDQWAALSEPVLALARKEQ